VFGGALERRGPGAPAVIGMGEVAQPLGLVAGRAATPGHPPTATFRGARFQAGDRVGEVGQPRAGSKLAKHVASYRQRAARGNERPAASKVDQPANHRRRGLAPRPGSCTPGCRPVEQHGRARPRATERRADPLHLTLDGRRGRPRHDGAARARPTACVEPWARPVEPGPRPVGRPPARPGGNAGP